MKINKTQNPLEISSQTNQSDTEYFEQLKKVQAAQSTRLHLLVIDDDPTFRALLKRAGEKQGFEISTCSSLKEVKPMIVPRHFDAVILDYYLDELKDNLRGTDVAWALESTPTVLISSHEGCLDENDGAWPLNIRKFVNKKSGAKAILRTAASFIPR